MKKLPATIQKGLSQEYINNQIKIDKAVRKVLASGRYILGKELERFEKRFADYVGCKYAVGVGNGFDALYISLMMLESDLVYIKNIKHKSAYNAVKLSYHEFVKKIEFAGIIINTIAPNLNYDNNFNDMIVIEDACQSIGMNRKVPKGVFTSCYSFHPLKLLHCYGDGGAITLNNKEVYKKIRKFRNHGRFGKTFKYGIGVNSRLDEVQAAVLNVGLDRLIEGDK